MKYYDDTTYVSQEEQGYSGRAPRMTKLQKKGGKLGRPTKDQQDIRTWTNFRVRLVVVDDANEKYIEERKIFTYDQLSAVRQAKARCQAKAILRLESVQELRAGEN